jgi:hypothetical protein
MAVRRRLVNILSAVSLLLFVVTFIAWLVSDPNVTLAACQDGARLFGLARYGRSVGCVWTHDDSGQKVPLNWGTTRFDRATVDADLPFEIGPSAIADFNQLGFRVILLRLDVGAILIPLWFLSVVFALPPLVWERSRRFRLRTTSNLCRVCGYDLRATPDRCPECGMVPHATRVSNPC